MTRILLRADDLGYSVGVNCGLAWACDNGLPMSVGLMVNLPDARHGYGLVAGHEHCLGMHTTISAGRPLSDPMEVPSLVDEGGFFFHPSDFYRNATSDPAALADVERDLAQGSLFVCANNQQVLAAFFCTSGPDPTYEHIDGAWLNDEPYVVVHRIAAREGSGAGRRCIAWACGQSNNVRIDTHEDNAPMRHVLTSLGFVECGVIICDNGTPRVAYQHAR